MLHAGGYDVRAYSRIGSLLAGRTTAQIACLITAERLPDGNGIDVVRHFRRGGWSGRAILIAAGPIRQMVEAFEHDFSFVLEKPLRKHALFAALETSVPYNS